MAWPRRQGVVEEEECGLSTAPAMALGVASHDAGVGIARCVRMELADNPPAEEGISHGTSTTSECRAGSKWSVDRVYLQPQLGSASTRDRPCWSVSTGNQRGRPCAVTASAPASRRDLGPLATGRPQCGCQRRCRVVIS